MRELVSLSPGTLEEALASLREARRAGRAAAPAGGGSDLLGMIKDEIVSPDIVVSLKRVRGLDGIEETPEGVTIGGLTTLATIERDARIREDYPLLAQAAHAVGTPQIRNVGTLAGNVCQRPWCWYFRQGFPCFKRGGDRCFSVGGENQQHAILGGDPSFIVHPSDMASALVALDARFRIAGPNGTRLVTASEFFVLPSEDASRENILTPEELLVGVVLPSTDTYRRSTYVKLMDREAWTHAVASVAMSLTMEQSTCRAASIVLGGVAPIPWRVPEAERLLIGRQLNEDLAEQVARAAVAAARPLSKNAYKVTMARALVRRTLLELAAA